MRLGVFALALVIGTGISERPRPGVTAEVEVEVEVEVERPGVFHPSSRSRSFRPKPSSRSLRPGVFQPSSRSRSFRPGVLGALTLGPETVRAGVFDLALPAVDVDSLLPRTEGTPEKGGVEPEEVGVDPEGTLGFIRFTIPRLAVTAIRAVDDRDGGSV